MLFFAVIVLRGEAGLSAEAGEADKRPAQIIGAPAFFSTVWGWIKRWFDPVTVSKIFILSHAEVLPTLKSFIPTANIPKKYGGELDFSWNDRPKLDDTILEAVTWHNGHSSFPEGPVYWRPVDGGKRLECVARGTVDKVERNEVVGSIAVAVAPPEVETEGEVGVEGASQAAAPTTDAPITDAQQRLAVPDTAALPEVASPASETFVDAPEVPLASPVPQDVVGGVQNLSLGEGAPNEKVVEAVEVVPNGKPVTTA